MAKGAIKTEVDQPQAVGTQLPTQLCSLSPPELLSASWGAGPSQHTYPLLPARIHGHGCSKGQELLAHISGEIAVLHALRAQERRRRVPLGGREEEPPGEQSMSITLWPIPCRICSRAHHPRIEVRQCSLAPFPAAKLLHRGQGVHVAFLHNLSVVNLIPKLDQLLPLICLPAVLWKEQGGSHLWSSRTLGPETLGKSLYFPGSLFPLL